MHPFISETISGVHDFSRGTKTKKNKFNSNSEIRFDWSLFDQYFNDEISQEFYFLKYVDFTVREGENEFFKNAKNLIDEITTEATKEDAVLGDRLLGDLSTLYVKEKRRPEPLAHMFKRNLEFKNLLKSHLEDESEQKILVFTHSAFTKISTSKLAYDMQVIPDFPEDCYKPDNCEILTMNI